MFILYWIKGCELLLLVNLVLPSEFRYQKCNRFVRHSQEKMSITTCVRGMNGKMGQFETLYFLRDFGSWESKTVSSIVRPLPVGSEMDHSFSVSNLSVDLHLHHMWACSLEAASIPVTIARNFQSPPRWYLIWKSMSLTWIEVSRSTSAEVSSNAALTFLVR